MSKASIVRNSMPPKNLSDMPIHVAELIIERSGYKEQLKLRKVSKSFRALVDSQKPACKSIQIEFYTRNVNITFDDVFVMYTCNSDNRVADDGEKANVIKAVDFKKSAFDDLASTLKNPKLQLEEFDFGYSFVWKKEECEKYKNDLEIVLKSLNHQLSVRGVKVQLLSCACLLSILPYFKPEVLEKISLCPYVRWTWLPTGMDQVASLEQWKKAETLEFPDFFDLFPMEYATHFKRFKFCEHRMTRNKFIRIRDFLSKLDSFEHCTLDWSGILLNPPLAQVLGAAVSSNATEEVFHQLVPNSNNYLEFKKAINSRHVEIEKKKRENN